MEMSMTMDRDQQIQNMTYHAVNQFVGVLVLLTTAIFALWFFVSWRRIRGRTLFSAGVFTVKPPHQVAASNLLLSACDQKNQSQ
jgi:hypothetical protein